MKTTVYVLSCTKRLQEHKYNHSSPHGSLEEAIAEMKDDYEEELEFATEDGEPNNFKTHIDNKSAFIDYFEHHLAWEIQPSDIDVTPLSSGLMECETTDCVFNNGGACRFSLVNDREPTITEEEGCLEGVIDVPI